MLPTTPTERAYIRLIEDAMDTHFEANTWGLSEVLIFGRVDNDEAERMCAFARGQIQEWYKWLEPRVAEADWFNSAEYVWGDICVWPFVNGAGRFGIFP